MSIPDHDRKQRSVVDAQPLVGAGIGF